VLSQRRYESQIQRTLFELSNRIGAFVVRALIEATNQENYPGIKVTKDSREQDTLAQEYLKRAISTLMISLLLAFAELIERIPSIRNKVFKTKQEDVYVWTCSECGYH
jgi:rubrerythrin